MNTQILTTNACHRSKSDTVGQCESDSMNNEYKCHDSSKTDDINRECLFNAGIKAICRASHPGQLGFHTYLDEF